MTTETLSKIVCAMMMLFALSIGSIGNRTQDQDDSKEIKAAVFMKARPAKKTPSNARYRRVVTSTGAKSITGPGSETPSAKIGFTLWRFRPSNASDKTKELVEEEEGQQSEWTLERVEAETFLLPGQRVRLSIESLSRDGYLYVIDREEFADGSLSDPLLIYPTAKTANSNRVQAGRLKYIPSDTGRFRIKPSVGPKMQVAEVLTIIVSPKPLLSIDLLKPKPIPLQREQVDAWQRQWGGTPAKFEMDGGLGQTMTPTEKSAASESSELLSQDDPVPQTVYEVRTKANEPVLITVPLRFAKKG